MGKAKTTEQELENIMAKLAPQIRRASRIMSDIARAEVTPEQVIRAALGVNTSNTFRDLTAKEVADEVSISEWQVNEAAREYVRTGGKSGLGPFHMFGRRRRFPRSSVEAWKASRLVTVHHNGPHGPRRAA